MFMNVTFVSTTLLALCLSQVTVPVEKTFLLILEISRIRPDGM